jgi:flagellar biosynthesis/type III secretory pathway protein FliH
MDVAEAVARAAREAIDELVERNGIVVRVHPAQVALVRERLAGWGEAARVVSDDTLPRDGCVIETQAGFIRAGLGEQVEIMRRALAEAASHAFATPDA